MFKRYKRAWTLGCSTLVPEHPVLLPEAACYQLLMSFFRGVYP